MRDEYQLKNVSAQDTPRVIEHLVAWQGEGGFGTCLQAGDLCWKMRFGLEAMAASLTAFTDATGNLMAVVLEDALGSWRLAHRPGAERSLPLANALVGWVARIDRPCSIDGPAGLSLWRRELAMVGFEPGTEPYAHLWKPHIEADVVDVPDARSVTSPQDADDRVTVQRAAFDQSTFTIERWQSMTAAPLYRPDLDLVARTRDGEPASALTAWFAGEGQGAVIEPMGTHRDFRRQGHGVRVLRAVSAQLARLGASGVSVCTPESNVGAKAVYRSAGFRQVGILWSMDRSGISVS